MGEEEGEEEEFSVDVIGASVMTGKAIIADDEEEEAEVEASIEGGRWQLKGTIVGGGVRDSAGGDGGGMGGRDRAIGNAELEFMESCRC